jgi:glycerol uptake facilitator-like aquaporin
MPDVGTAPPPTRRLVAEFVGTGLLVTAVVGSGIMASRLSPNDVGLQLLENSIATAATVARAFTDTFAGIAPASVPAYIAAQLVGGVLAVGLLTMLYPEVGRVGQPVAVPHDARPRPSER